MDLQCDFLDRSGGRMPVDEQGAQTVIQVANEVLSRRILADALPVLVKNQFPATVRIANFFRHGAAVRGTAGAELDPRLVRSGSELVITKSTPSSFSNPKLERDIHAHGVQDLYVLGVFAEGCVRSKAVEAVKRGHAVHVIANAVAKAFALWAIARAGAGILPSVVSPGSPAARPAADGR
jgi:nicotinamidase-related amidase